MAAETVLHIDTIISNPKIRSGRAVITGTGICVSDIAAHHIFAGMSPEEIAVSYRLNLSQVYSALAYYYTNKSDIDDEIRRSAKDADTLLQELRKQGKVIE